jgi:uncharacterized membrane protein YtjA (UPF0391 family)
VAAAATVKPPRGAHLPRRNESPACRSAGLRLPHFAVRAARIDRSGCRGGAQSGINSAIVVANKRSAMSARARRGIMLYYALVFLVVALIAGALGVSGVAAIATNIAYVLFVIAIVLFLVHFISGRRTVV